MRRTVLAMGALLLGTPNCSQEDQGKWDDCGKGYEAMASAGAALSANDDLRPLYAPCDDDAECESGTCPTGYCTMTCVTVHDCEPEVAECAPFADGNICMPVCEDANDCASYGCSDGACSSCSSVAAVNGITVSVCADNETPVE